MPFLFDEDRALKEKLSGFKVVNYADGREIPIQVWYRFPDPEEREKRTFPHISIDLIDILPANDRAHRAFEFVLPYDLEQATPATDFNLVGDDFPLPWSLEYQLSTYARQPTHDRYMQMMMTRMFPNQYGSLNMAAYDGTVRRADLISHVRRDTVDANNKRLYRVVYTVAISAEFFVNEVRTVKQALSVNLDFVGDVGPL